MNTSHQTASPFVAQWIANARAYVKEAKASGTTGQSADCLFQCVRIPSQSLQGAPLGTNAQYAARELFTCEVSPTLGKFVL